MLNKINKGISKGISFILEIVGYNDPLKYTILSISFILPICFMLFGIKGFLFAGLIILLIKIDSYGNYRDKMITAQYHLVASRIMVISKKLKIKEEDVNEILETMDREDSKRIAFYAGVKPEDFEFWRNKKLWDNFFTPEDFEDIKFREWEKKISN